MKELHKPFSKEIAFFSSVTPVYGVTLLLLLMSIKPYLPQFNSPAYALTPTIQSAVEKKNLPPKKIISGKPISIHIPKLDLNKEVLPGQYDSKTGIWRISDIGVHFAELSSRINDSSGNSLLYAHNNKWAFGLLYLLEKGDIVEVKTDSGYNFRYIFSHSGDYEPSDTSLFAYSGPPILTLQTCSGYFNEYRHLYTFNLSKVEKI